MRFLITNDDGYDAPGLMALYRALKPLGEVTVVAPLTCHSSKGHAVDTKNALRVERRHVDPYGPIHIAHASPADCIRVGLKHVMQEKPDFVIAGINPGANLGVDMFYSGTAAAAREAALLGVPAIALSRPATSTTVPAPTIAPGTFFISAMASNAAAVRNVTSNTGKPPATNASAMARACAASSITRTGITGAVRMIFSTGVIGYSL
jgi:5'/3'-nucleotidase SurE